MTSFWSCAQTHPRSETIALQHLRRRNFQAFFPFFLTRTKNRHYSVQPVFPSYIFVQINETDAKSWSPINFAPGITRLLTGAKHDDEYQQPYQLDDAFIEGLYRSRIRSTDKGDQLAEGTMVRVLRGPFAERIALVSAASDARIKLLMQVMNRELEIEFEVADLEVVSSPMDDNV